MERLTLDTNIIILASKDNAEVIRFLDVLKERQVELHVSTISKLELFSHPLAQANELLFIRTILREIYIHVVNEEITDQAAFFRRVYRIPTVDAIIAATAFAHSDGHLWSLDKVFSKIPEIKLFEGK